MKTLIVLMLVVLCSQPCLSQKCKYPIDKKDAFSGEMTRGIRHSNHGWTWTSMKKGDKYFVEMSFIHAGDIKKSMTPQDSVLVKLADGTILHLHPSTDVPPVSSSQAVSTGSSIATTRTVDLTSFAPLFQVDRETFEKLSKSGLKAIRLDFTGKPLDFDFTAKPLTKSVEPVMEDAGCILALK